MQSKKQPTIHLFKNIYPLCCKIISGNKLQRLIDRCGSPDLFVTALSESAADLQLPEYLPELARIEAYASALRAENSPMPEYSERLGINPTLQLFENTWQNLYLLLDENAEPIEPVRGKESIIVWKNPADGNIRAKPVTSEDLLVLKMALENLSEREVANQGGVSLAAIAVAVVRTLNAGIVTGPTPEIRRNYHATKFKEIGQSFLSARVFSLQWHITQACDLHCRHCYDRSQYKSLSFEQEKGVLEDLAGFCTSRNVHGQVTFSGGNPFLHPHFEELYKEASDHGFSIAILGNPASRGQVERLKAIQPPAFYQVSLEGLESHNDYMRGKGHFQRVLDFLEMLRELKVYSMVMLTLTQANMNQVLPLASVLRTRVDLFTFNRLSMVGEGASLAPVDYREFPVFLEEYAAAVESNPCLGLKENLLNIIYDKEKKPIFGGCTGHGCGAAFNFMALLADGTVHACRKFPSPLGNIRDHSLDTVYNSAAAEKYRQGAAECRDCRLNPVCRGCLAVSYSHGYDIYRQKDPYCFLQSAEQA
jgi:selenobiotic family peptide radical SAM maturase